MPQPKPFWYGLLIAILYFLSVSFAVAALRPSLAVQAGMIAAILAVAFYMVLVLIGQEEHGKPLGILLFFPGGLCDGRDAMVGHATVGVVGG